MPWGTLRGGGGLLTGEERLLHVQVLSFCWWQHGGENEAISHQPEVLDCLESAESRYGKMERKMPGATWVDISPQGRRSGGHRVTDTRVRWQIGFRMVTWAPSLLLPFCLFE